MIDIGCLGQGMIVVIKGVRGLVVSEEEDDVGFV